MIKPSYFYEILKQKGVLLYAGVPDSLLKHFCAFVDDNHDKHIIAANEGNAVGIAAGHYLATGKIPVVYMQNSGQGNAINPLISLSQIYNMPLLLLIGWRGEPGTTDEPQHKLQGEITTDLLDACRIPYQILPGNGTSSKLIIDDAFDYMKAHSKPYALVIKKDFFEPYESKKKTKPLNNLSREDAIKKILKNIEPDSIVIGSTGKISREIYANRKNHDKDFLTVGSMGHTSQIALGIALETEKIVYCIEGDGSFLMHLGGGAIIGEQKPKNYRHIILNNNCHDSVGGQATAKTNFETVAKALKYNKTFKAKDKESIQKHLNTMKKLPGPLLLEIIVKPGSKKNLGRPKKHPTEYKKIFTEKLR